MKELSKIHCLTLLGKYVMIESSNLVRLWNVFNINLIEKGIFSSRGNLYTGFKYGISEVTLKIMWCKNERLNYNILAEKVNFLMMTSDDEDILL